MITRLQWLCLVLGLCSTASPITVSGQTPNFKVIYQWKQLEFDYETTTDRQNDIDSGIFTPGVIAPIDVDVFYSNVASHNEVFISVPKFIQGIPATLGTVSNKMFNGNPVIAPFPDWSWHRNSKDCHRDRIVSVFRMKTDECGRLWVLDTGKIGSDYICLPQIMAFDLSTHRLIHRYEIPKSVTGNNHLLVTPEIDVRDPNSGCGDTFVYMADVLGSSLIVYDVVNDRSWKIQDKTFYPYPTFGTYNIADDSFELMDGLLGLALSPLRQGEDRVLFYHAMSSPTENWVYTSYLRNRTLFDNGASVPQVFNTYPSTRNTQVAAEAIDKDGIMYFGLERQIQFVCWNSRTEYTPKNFDVISNDHEKMQFASGVKVVRNQKGQQELWILTSRFQKVAAGTLNPNEVNFRILAGKVDDILHGSKCKSKLPHRNQIHGGYGLYGPSGRGLP